MSRFDAHAAPLDEFEASAAWAGAIRDSMEELAYECSESVRALELVEVVITGGTRFEETVRKMLTTLGTYTRDHNRAEELCEEGEEVLEVMAMELVMSPDVRFKLTGFLNSVRRFAEWVQDNPQEPA